MTSTREATLTAVGMLLIAAFTLTIGFHWRHGHWIWEGLI